MEGDGGQNANANRYRCPIAWVRPSQARNREQPSLYDEFESIGHHAHQYEPNRAIIKSGHCDFQTKLRKRTKARQRELAVLGVMPKTSALLL